MEPTLTSKQQQILSCIKQSIKERNYPPSVREICLAVGLSSTSTVHSHLNTLERKGYIKRDPSKPRTIEVLETTPNTKEHWLKNEVTPVPYVGKVTAGLPISTIENLEDFFPLPKHFAGEDSFILEVSGTSMINAGILDGDRIIVKKQHTAHNGDIVVAKLNEDSITVKRFFKEKTRVRLQPENDTMSPIYSDDVEIVGRVIGLFREF